MFCWWIPILSFFFSSLHWLFCYYLLLISDLVSSNFSDIWVGGRGVYKLRKKIIYNNLHAVKIRCSLNLFFSSNQRYTYQMLLRYYNWAHADMCCAICLVMTEWSKRSEMLPDFNPHEMLLTFSESPKQRRKRRDTTNIKF